MTKEIPKVSVLMPCYNHENYVSEAIESILNQTYKNIELIIVDNGSTDNSYEALKKYENKIYKLIQLPENDIYKCGYILDKYATGDYIAIMTSDDYWYPEKIEKQVDMLEKNPKMVACSTLTQQANEQLDQIIPKKHEERAFNRTRAEWIRYLLTGNNCLFWASALIRRENYYSLRLRGYRQLDDVFCWVQLLMQGELYVLQEPLMIFRWHSKGENRNESFPTKKANQRMCNEWSDLLDSVIESMDDAMFLEAFREDLREASPANKVEIACEKLFVLQKLANENLGYYYNVLRFYYRHYNRSIMEYEGSFVETLYRKYNYSTEDFWEWSGRVSLAHLSNDYMTYYSWADKEIKNKDKRILSLRKSLIKCAEKDETLNLTKELYQTLLPTEKRKIKEFVTEMQQVVLLNDEVEISKVNQFELKNQLKQISLQLDGMWELLDYVIVGMNKKEWELYKKEIQETEIDIDLSNEVIVFFIKLKNSLRNL